MLAHGTLFWWAPQSLGRKGSVHVCALSSAKPVLMKAPPRRAATPHWHFVWPEIPPGVAQRFLHPDPISFCSHCSGYTGPWDWVEDNPYISPWYLWSPWVVTSKWTSSWERSHVQLPQTLTCAGAEQRLHKPPSMASQSQYFCQPWSIQLTLEDAIFNSLSDLMQIIFWRGCL